MPTAYAYAAQYRDEIRALCVLGPACRGSTRTRNATSGTPAFTAFETCPSGWSPAGSDCISTGSTRKGRTIRRRSTTRPATSTSVRCYSQAGGLRGGFEYYRAYETDAEHNRTHAEDPLEVPVLALGGGAASFQDLPIRDMEAVATDVEGEVVDRAGHWIPEERPAYFVDRLTAFLNDAA